PTARPRACGASQDARGPGDAGPDPPRAGVKQVGEPAPRASPDDPHDVAHGTARGEKASHRVPPPAGKRLVHELQERLFLAGTERPDVDLRMPGPRRDDLRGSRIAFDGAVKIEGVTAQPVSRARKEGQRLVPQRDPRKEMPGIPAEHDAAAAEPGEVRLGPGEQPRAETAAPESGVDDQCAHPPPVRKGPVGADRLARDLRETKP